VIVDLAAETGGNCRTHPTRGNVCAQRRHHRRPVNLPSMGAIHASEMYARNLYNFLALSLKDGALNLDWTTN
jgi:NAD(P) transhydrogenase subunit alpha